MVEQKKGIRSMSEMKKPESPQVEKVTDPPTNKRGIWNTIAVASITTAVLYFLVWHDLGDDAASTFFALIIMYTGLLPLPIIISWLVPWPARIVAVGLLGMMLIPLDFFFLFSLVKDTPLMAYGVLLQPIMQLACVFISVYGPTWRLQVEHP